MEKESDILILGIESSCDETSVAVVKNGREVLSNVISSQIDVHKLYGGVVPEIASRNHVVNIDGVLSEALSQAGVKLEDVSAIAVTYGAGLLGALIVGVNFAKALSYKYKKPLIAVNHIEGHIAANYIEHKDLKFLVTEIGCGIAGFKVEEMAELFREALKDEYDNVYLPQRFADYLKK